MTLRPASAILALGFLLIRNSDSRDTGSARAADSRGPRILKQVHVYAVDGRFGGWPANHGIWSWGDEIVVGFSAGYYKDLGPKRHAIDRERPEHHLLARSKDGGETWTIEDPAPHRVLVGAGGMRHGKIPPGQSEPEPVEPKEPIDFTGPDFALTVRMSKVDGGRSRYYSSQDRAHTWKGPFALPLCGQSGIAARTDYIVNGKHDCMLFVTASKADGREGKVVCIRTTDGGLHWNFVSQIGPEPAGYAIMPSTVRLSPTELFTTIRRREGNDAWIDAYRSRDNAKTWEAADRPASDLGEGNPPALLRLRDGRLALAYGVRKTPFAIRARISGDGGKSWGDAIVLRPDAASRDIGYPRMVERPDGKLVTIYYFHDKSDVDRTIDATIWEP